MRRFHRTRKVRLHASGRWVTTIGRVLSPRTGRLIDKDWYFSGSEAEAAEKAQTKARQWELLVRNWAKTEQPMLETLAQPMPEEPRWPVATGSTRAKQIAPDVLQSIRRERSIEPEELAQAYSEFSFSELIPVYKNDRWEDLRDREAQNSSVAKEIGQMTRAAEFLPHDVPGRDLTAEHFRKAKQLMLAANLGRRTTKNYLSAAVKLLKHVQARYGGAEGSVALGIHRSGESTPGNQYKGAHLRHRRTRGHADQTGRHDVSVGRHVGPELRHVPR